jgi:hypothetical protein
VLLAMASASCWRDRRRYRRRHRRGVWLRVRLRVRLQGYKRGDKGLRKLGVTGTWPQTTRAEATDGKLGVTPWRAIGAGHGGAAPASVRRGRLLWRRLQKRSSCWCWARGCSTSFGATRAADVAEAARAFILLVLGTRVQHQHRCDDGGCCGGGCRSDRLVGA